MVWTLVRPLFRAVSVNSKPFKVNRIYWSREFTTKYYCTQVKSSDESEDAYDKLVKDVTNGNLELENAMRLILLEMDVLRQDGRRAPSPFYVKKQHWSHLFDLKTRSSRQRYMSYLFEIEMKDSKKKAEKQENALILEKKRLEFKVKKEEKLKSNELRIEYGLQDLSMFLRIYESSINKMDNHRLHQAAMFGQKLIIDCSYDRHMTFREQSNAGNQLTMLFAMNRIHRNPFDIHFCNVNMETETFRKVQRNIPTWNEPWFPLNLHNESYLDLFPKEKLVYLSPHCRTELTEYDHDAYYIIGCMVDKSNPEPLSLAKAKEYNLKVVKLPLDRYLQWMGGSGKSLTLDQVTRILLDVKTTGDWNEALKHVPRRKLQCGDNISTNYKPGKFTYTSRIQKNELRDTTKPFDNKFSSRNYNEKSGAQEDKRKLVNKHSTFYKKDR